MSDPQSAIPWKQNYAPGIQIFKTAQGVVKAGLDPADFVSVGGVMLKWPAALGSPPDDATVATWSAEYDAFLAAAPTEPDTFTKREQAILVAAALLAGATPQQAKAQARARFQQAMGLL